MPHRAGGHYRCRTELRMLREEGRKGARLLLRRPLGLDGQAGGTSDIQPRPGRVEPRPAKSRTCALMEVVLC